MGPSTTIEVTPEDDGYDLYLMSWGTRSYITSLLKPLYKYKKNSKMAAEVNKCNNG